MSEQTKKSKPEWFCGVDLPILSIDNEIKALELFKSVCTKALEKYPESYERDIELLKNPGLSFNERNCLLFRASEKNVLTFILSRY